MLEQALHELLDANASVKIATTSGAGVVWVATAYFVQEGLYSLNVLVEARGRTLTNMRENPGVAVMIENGDAFALFAQAEGPSKIVDDRHDQVRDAIAAKTPQSAPLVGLPNLVAVQIDVLRWRLTHVAAGWIPGKELSRP